MTENVLKICSLVATAAIVAGSSRSLAQDATSPSAVNTQAQTQASGTQSAGSKPHGRGIEEVVVTAQRRSQSAQKTALTVAVVSPKTLANAGITSALQLTSIAPTLQIGAAGPSSAVYVRGVGDFGTTAEQSPAVPYYADGIYVARTQSVSSEFYDVARLEVVKGPQGTLYGRNATGGAINIITNNPVLGKYSGYADFELGNYSNKNGDFALNVPLSPTVALRLSGQIVDKGGYTSNGFGDDVHQSARAKLLWRPDDVQSLIVNASYGHIGGLGPAYAVLNKDVAGWNPWLDVTSPAANAYLVSHGLAPIPGFIRPELKSDAGQDLSFYNVSAQYDYNFGPVTLSLLPAFRYSDMQNAVLFGTVEENGYGFGSMPAKPETSSAESFEARLSGKLGNLRYVSGFYFYNEKQYQEYSIDAGTPEHDAFASGFGTRSYAAFGQATYSITPHVRLIGGLRYTNEQRTLTDGQNYVISPSLFLGPPPIGGAACGLPAPTQPQCQVDSYAGSKTFTNVSWKGGFEADVLEDSLLYATASRGFKSGGFNTQSAVGEPGQALGFNPETLTSYEIGLKNRFLDGRLQLNVSGYYWDYRNHQEPQLVFTNAGLLNLVFFNAGAVQIYGGDLDVVARPWEGGVFNTSVEYANSRYDSFDYLTPVIGFNPASTGCQTSPAATPGQINVNCKGFEAAKTPKFAGSVGFAQDFSLYGGTLTANLAATFASARWLGVDFIPIERAPGYISLNTSLTYVFPGEHWSLTLFGRNVNNARIYTAAFTNPLSTLYDANIAAPATYGARLSFRF